MEAIKTLRNIEGTGSTTNFDIEDWKNKCYEAMNDDFNTPVLIAHLFEAVKQINLIKEGKGTITAQDKKEFESIINTFIYDVLGLLPQETSSSHSEKLDGVVNLLISLRNEARQNRDFKTSDKIRDELAELGVQLKDGKEGTTFSIN